MSWGRLSNYQQRKLNKAFERADKEAALREQNGRCKYCLDPLSVKAATRDHVIPRVAGGLNHKENIVAACAPCNQAKPIMSKGGRPELFPNKLAAVEAVMLHLVRYVNGHLYRHGEVAGETAATADAAFNQVLKQKGKTRVITVAYRGKSSRCQRK
ncbi:HNH endonuclease [Pseudochrobactrum sp. Wa41.01b-1]|uniref:HNH endonuclease n=1 Tax=Pseudochrobactrum sp. Wa41.01b-1 TaxID=2864102 RepID=UPI001C68E330|nr:HNH endonuclease signature motif containing protein [Pseudochrobactrum sp. Wa41.01b-1]QYM73242.1 HNH endonuclease [Pseudochrobactrum sp. Wa41.01b-1]